MTENQMHACKQKIMIKIECPDCGTVFEIPFEDRVNVLLFGHYEKYHVCERVEEGK